MHEAAGGQLHVTGVKREMMVNQEDGEVKEPLRAEDEINHRFSEKVDVEVASVARQYAGSAGSVCEVKAKAEAA